MIREKRGDDMPAIFIHSLSLSIATGNSTFRELHRDERETSKPDESKMCVT